MILLLHQFFILRENYSKTRGHNLKYLKKGAEYTLEKNDVWNSIP